MARVKIIIFLIMLFSGFSATFAQLKESPIRVFGYFQNSFQHWTESLDHPAYNSFALQQLNMFLQKDLAKNWTAFVNFEVLNNFSSSRRWGSFNIEEAWVRYRASRQFNLKVGLLIPTFNYLNEYKNRTPLLPYIARPLVYETSFDEFIAIEEFLPRRAFVQAYGFIPSGKAKFDYAVYVGNSPNINDQFTNELYGEKQQTGIDTTTTFLLGGRLGLRYKELRAGFSLTHEKTNIFIPAAERLNEPVSKFQERPRVRLGADISYHLGDISFEGEYIGVFYDEGTETVEVDKRFLYGTLGWQTTEQLFVYGSYWYTLEHRVEAELDSSITKYTVDTNVITGGASYNLSDRITLKAQVARVDVSSNLPLSLFPGTDWLVYSAAISIFF